MDTGVRSSPPPVLQMRALRAQLPEWWPVLLGLAMQA